MFSSYSQSINVNTEAIYILSDLLTKFNMDKHKDLKLEDDTIVELGLDIYTKLNMDWLYTIYSYWTVSIP